MNGTGCKIGLLLIDGNKNTILLDKETSYEVIKRYGYSLGDNVRQHKTLNELDRDVRKYLNADYENPGGLRE